MTLDAMWHEGNPHADVRILGICDQFRTERVVSSPVLTEKKQMVAVNTVHTAF